MSGHDEELTRGEATVALLAGFVGLFGTYWDDAWHTDRGRDVFASPPHLVLYAGVLVVLAVALRWAARVAHPGRWTGVLSPRRRAAVACWGGLAVLASAPIDEFWHRAYGRDAVLWSPPHLLAMSGSAALLAGLVLGMPVGTTRARLGSALVLGAFLVPVMEYEADVPQFGAALYLPVVVLGVALARPVTVAAGDGGWPLAAAAAWYTVFRLLVVGGLAALGHSTPIVPPILLAAVTIDLVARVQRRWVGPVVTVAAVTVVYVPILAVLPGAPAVRGSALVVGVMVSLAAAGAGVVASGGRRQPVVASGLMLVVVVLVTAALTEPAAAHDPGQGDVVGDAAFRVTVDDLDLDVTVDLPDGVCSGGSIDIVGRRGGRTIRIPAEVRAGCVAGGALVVDKPGRWFVYVEQDRIEGWVPVEAGGHRAIADIRDLYRRPTSPAAPTQPLAGGVLVAAAIVLLVATSRAAGARCTAGAPVSSNSVPSSD